MTDSQIALGALVIAAIGLGVNAVYTGLTWRQLRETSRLRQAQTDPAVIVYLEQSPHAFQVVNLVVRNVGAGTAYRVRLHIVGDDWTTLQDRTISELGLVTTGLDVLGAGDAIRTVAGTVRNIVKRERKAFTLRVTYAAAPNAPDRSEYFTLNASAFLRIVGVEESPDAAAARALARIADRLDRLGKTDDRFNVGVWTRTDREREEAEWMAVLEEGDRASRTKR
ncbi:hypothetical protein tb265_20070 [Gemmatimonadetes bacterium T265]|nr:hypothetical protein tb265_20070 [Gemmatimonadetes bacterium T265]